MSLPAVTKHLKVLQRALISQSREAQWRPCHLRANHARSGGVDGPYRTLGRRLDRLDDYLRESTGKPALRSRKKK
jgi:hypothetical protein